MTRANINGIQLAYETYGEMDLTPMVLIRGLGTQLIDWSEVFLQTLVDAGLYVIIFDNRDAGLSQKFDAAGKLDMARVLRFEQQPAYSARDMVEDLVGLMDHLDLERVHLFGISLGAMIAQLCAFEYPHRLFSIMSVMSSSSRKGLPQATLEARQAMQATPDPAGSRQAVIDLVAHNMAVFGSPGYPESLAVRQVMAAKQYDRCYCPDGVTRQMAALVSSGDRSDKLRQIRVPTGVIHGTDDPLIPIACGRDTAELIPGATFVAVEGMGHNIPASLSELMTHRVMEHLSSYHKKRAGNLL